MGTPAQAWRSLLGRPALLSTCRTTHCPWTWPDAPRQVDWHDGGVRCDDSSRPNGDDSRCSSSGSKSRNGSDSATAAAAAATAATADSSAASNHHTRPASTGCGHPKRATAQATPPHSSTGIRRAGAR
ncbi:hypothetical protein DIPPA_09780 [Diplonema papillatum]|nr:hypothetical protein DIPPA_09761 [Diplonema papillatum]KAJ9466001.1 hypothetical protein DIPPA_09780 [Diplonema papillatum]